MFYIPRKNYSGQSNFPPSDAICFLIYLITLSSDHIETYVKITMTK